MTGEERVEKSFAAAFSELKDQADVDAFLVLCPLDGEATVPPARLLFPRFREDSPDLEALVEWLCLSAVNYAIPLRKRRLISNTAVGSASGGDMTLAARLVREAKASFLSFNRKYPNRAGEVGELLAYLLALRFLDAPQIASKMALKTSSNMPIHGSDGVHARFENGVMTLFFLESKLSLTAKGGTREYAKSASGSKQNRKQYLLEYGLLSDLGNLSALSDENRTLALEYLDVYGSRKAHRIERSVGMICYSEKQCFTEKLPKSSSSPPAAHEEHFSARFAKHGTALAEQAKTFLTKKNVDPSDCILFFVAVPDVRQLREKFQEGIR